MIIHYIDVMRGVGAYLQLLPKGKGVNKAMGDEARGGRSLWERRSFRCASLEDRATPLMIVRCTHLMIASLEDGSRAAVYLKTKIRFAALAAKMDKNLRQFTSIRTSIKVNYLFRMLWVNDTPCVSLSLRVIYIHLSKLRFYSWLLNPSYLLEIASITHDIRNKLPGWEKRPILIIHTLIICSHIIFLHQLISILYQKVTHHPLPLRSWDL